MARVLLNEDTPGVGSYDPPRVHGVAVALDPDDLCAPCGGALGIDTGSGTDPGPAPARWVIALRVVASRDDDGVPTFAWNEVLTGLSTEYEEREEFDAIGSFTGVKARLALAYSGSDAVPESAAAIDPDGRVWRVTKSRTVNGRLELVLDRIEQTGV